VLKNDVAPAATSPAEAAPEAKGLFEHREQRGGTEITGKNTYQEVTKTPPEVCFRAFSRHRGGKPSSDYGVVYEYMT
jgi:hypothetical protein